MAFWQAVDNLYCVGDSCFPGQGVIAVCFSGVMCAHRVAADLGKLFVGKAHFVLMFHDFILILEFPLKAVPSLGKPWKFFSNLNGSYHSNY